MEDNENSEGCKVRRPSLASPTFLKRFGVKDGLSNEMLYSFCICVVFEINRTCMLILVNLAQCAMIQITRNGYCTPS